MTRPFTSWFVLCCGFWWGASCLAAVPVPRSIEARQGELLVSAASSLTDVLEEIARAFERATGGRITLNFAGSNTLARQIIAGAPVDVFVSANPEEMDRVQQVGRILEDTRVDVLSNQLVVVTPDDRLPPPRSVRDLLGSGIDRIAIGNPGAVPAGVYTRRYLESRNLWSAIAPKVVPTRSVRAALAAVEAGNADAAFVYRTDAMTMTRATLAFRVPIAETPAIAYPAAVMTDSWHADRARCFLAYLVGPEARRIFERAGFVVIAPEAAGAGAAPVTCRLFPTAFGLLPSAS